jgi:hypothetical protein
VLVAPKGLALKFFGSGSGRVEPPWPLTLIVGTAGAETVGIGLGRPLLGAGESFTEMLGIGGVTPIDGNMLYPRVLTGRLTDIAGVSETEMVGIEGAEAGISRPLLGAGDSLTDMLGMGGVTPIDGVFIPRPLDTGDSLTEILGIGGVTPTDGAFVV